MKNPLMITMVAMLVAACSQRSSAPTGEVSTSAPPQGPTAGEMATTDANEGPNPGYPSDYKIDQPIPAADIDTQLSMVGHPSYNPKKDLLAFDVRVSNRGRTALVTSGQHPVWMALHLAGPQGIDKPPGKRLVGRARLPLIVEKSTGTVHARIPASKILNYTLRVELFQERVGWFSSYGQPTMDVGVFVRCKGAPQTLCDASDTPLPAPTPMRAESL